MTGINTGSVSDPVAPFGGVKESGFGREGGRHGIEEFQTSKVCSLNRLLLDERLVLMNNSDNHARRSRFALHSSVRSMVDVSQATLGLGSYR